MRLQGFVTALLACALTHAADAKCRTKRFNATFDNMAVNDSPRDGYAGLRYTNWFVGSGDLIPPTAPNYLQAQDSNTGYLSLDFPKGYDATLQFNLHSFYMGCTINVGDGPMPAGCTVTVTTKTFSNGFPIEQHNFTFALKGSGKKLFKMQKMDAGDLAGTNMYFGVAAGAGGTQLYLDSLELSQVQCK